MKYRITITTTTEAGLHHTSFESVERLPTAIHGMPGLGTLESVEGEMFTISSQTLVEIKATPIPDAAENNGAGEPGEVEGIKIDFAR